MNKRQSFNSGVVFFFCGEIISFICMTDYATPWKVIGTDGRDKEQSVRGRKERKTERERESNEGRNNAKSQWRLTSHDYSSDNDLPQTPDLCMMNAPT